MTKLIPTLLFESQAASLSSAARRGAALVTLVGIARAQHYALVLDTLSGARVLPPVMLNDYVSVP
jgi:hypothetical protein